MESNNAKGFLLTRRELLVLKIMSQGLSNKQMAGELSISPLTIKTHIQNIYLKLEVNNKISALIKSEAVRNTPFRV